MLQPPSGGISSLGLHPYAGKASYVDGGSGGRDNAGGTSSITPQQKKRDNRPKHPPPAPPAQPPATPRQPQDRKWSNLFGVIDTTKLQNLMGGGKW